MMNRIIRSLFLLLAISFSATVNAETQYWEYTFRPGDTIWDLAKKYTTSVDNWSEIQRINELRQGRDRKIRPGTRVVIPVSMLKLQPTPARVIAVNSGVQLLRANGEKAEITTQTKLYSGDRVITQDRQSLRLQFADQSELQVLPNSEVVLDRISYYQSTGMVDTRVRLNSGSVNTWVEKQRPDSHYEIRTPAAITAVRGTAFRLTAASRELSRTEVIEGTVAVSAAKTEKAVKEGYGIVAEKDKPLPEPVKLLAAPVLGDNQSVEQTELQLTWAKLDGAKAYRYQLANDIAFNNIITDATTPHPSINTGKLQPAQYYLRVRGIDQYELEGVDAVADYKIIKPPPPLPVEEDDYWEIIMGIGFGILLL